LVEPGDANPEVGTNTLKVLLLSKKATGEVLSSFAVSPAVITPNQDELNDHAIISYVITQMLGEAEVKIGLYDLMGGLVREFSTMWQRNGFYEKRWDGRDEDGQLMCPGVYLCMISVKTETKSFEEIRSVVVAY
jgi:flagellar hook assembly protein FlgD